MRGRVPALALAACAALSLTAAEWRVDAVRGSADGDGTITRPFAEIQSALEIASPDDTVLVAPGRYGPLVNRLAAVTVRAAQGPSATVVDGRGLTRCLDDFGDLTLEGFTLVNGRASDGYGGGGACGGTLVRCVISNCTAAASGGGASFASLIDCLLVGNSSGAHGGGAYGCLANGCTFAENAATGFGGGLCLGGVYARAVNCVLAFNVSLEGFFGGHDLYDPDAYAARCFSNDDPRFADRAAGDWRLAAASPCIDAGITGCAEEARDLAGLPRLAGAAVDLGCYERPRAAAFGERKRAVSAAARTLTCRVFADGAWTLSSDASWLRPRQPSGTGAQTVEVEVSANAQGGVRTGTLRLAASDGAQVALQPWTQVGGVERGAANYALLVGLDAYDPEMLGEADWLDGCLNDVAQLRERCLASGLWHPDAVVALTNAAARKASVLAALADLAGRARAGDVVLYCHSGHGRNAAYDQRQTFLVAYDGLISDAELAASLAGFASGVRVVVVADTCHSGGLFDRPPSFPATTALGGVAFAVAADYDQLAWSVEHEGVPCGAFTRALAEGWRTGAADADGDGRLSFFELFAHAAAQATGYEDDYPFNRSDAQSCNEPLLLATLAAVHDPKWPDPGVTAADDAETAAGKVREALREMGYGAEIAARVTTPGQYRALAVWSETAGVPPSEQNAAALPLLSAALRADGLLTPPADGARVGSMAVSDGGWRFGVEFSGRARSLAAEPAWVHAGLLAAAVSVETGREPTGPFAETSVRVRTAAGGCEVLAGMGGTMADRGFFRLRLR